MKYLVDSDYVADYLVGKPSATTLLHSLRTEGIAISLVTFGEIYEGIYFGRDPEQAEEVFRRFLRVTETLPLTKTILRRFARIRGELRQRGAIIGDFDTLIAATDLQHNLILVTRNTRHYQRILDLQLLS